VVVVASYFDPDEHRKMMDAITGRNSIAKIMQDQRKMLDLFSGRVFRDQMRVLSGQAISDQMDVLSGRAMKRQMDLLSGRTVTDQLRRITDHWNSIATRPFASAIGAQDSIARIVSQPNFGSLVGTDRLPLADWSRVLDGLRGFVPDDLYEETAAGFEAAAEATDEGRAGLWWVPQMPLWMQFALLLPVLETIDKATEFAGDLAGVDVPPAVRSGVQLLLMLTATLVAFIEARATVIADQEQE